MLFLFNFFMYNFFFLLIMFLSMNNWLLLWMFLELMFMFIFMIISINKIIDQILIYFICQSFLSMMMLYLIMINNSFFFMNLKINKFILINIILLKLNLFPFHYWIIFLSIKLNWINIYILNYINKIPLIFLIMNFNNLLNYIFLNFIFLFNLNMMNFKKFYIFFSIINLSWFILTLNYNFFMFMFNFIIYILMNFIFLYNLFLSNLNFMNQFFYLNYLNKFFFLFMLFNIIGLPPCFMFFIKWMLINMIYLNLIIMNLIIIMMFIYMIMFIKFIIMMLIMLNYKIKWFYKNNNNLKYLIFFMNINFIMLI